MLQKNNLKLFISIFCLLNIVFCYYQFNFMFGNHDWDWMKGTDMLLSLNTGLFEGRYAKFILNILLFGGHIIPIFNAMIGFTLLSVGGILLIKYWHLEINISSLLIILSFTLSPFILEWLYFAINILGNFMIIPLVLTGLMLSQKCSFWYGLISIVCYLICYGVYPSSIETILICYSFHHLINAKYNYRIMSYSFSLIVISLMLYKLILFILEYNQMLYIEQYNMQNINNFEYISKLPEVIILLFKQLVTSIPFVSFKLKFLGIIIIILGFIKSIIRNSNKLITFFLWCVIFFATILTSYLAKDINSVYNMARINFYGLNFLYAGSIAILLSSKSYYKNIGYILSLIFIYLSITSVFEAQKVWNLGYKAENNLVNRISARISSRENKKLTPVFTGELSLREKYYNDKYDMKSPYLLNSSYMVRHIPSGMYNFFAPYPVFYTTSQISNLDDNIYNFLNTASKPYPNSNSIYIDNNYAIILLTSQGLRQIKSQLPNRQ